MQHIAVLGHEKRETILHLIKKRAEITDLIAAQAVIALKDASEIELKDAHSRLLPIVSLAPLSGPLTHTISSPKDAVKEACRLGRNRSSLSDRLSRVGITIDVYKTRPPKYIFSQDGDANEYGLKKVDRVPEGGRAMDLASILPVLALDLSAGERMLDLCAAPGNKSAFAWAISQPQLTCVEPQPARMQKMRRFFREEAIPATFVQQDGRRVRGTFQKILLDAPCSGEGIVTKLDRVLNVGPAQIKRKARIQLQLLEHAWTLLENGGRLVYATCALNREENEDVITRFLKKTQAKRIVFTPPLSIPTQIDVGVRVLPGQTRGLWYAVLEK